MPCVKHPTGWVYGCPECAAEDSAHDWQDAMRRAELANSYANVDLESLLRDINLLQQIAMFKLHTERLAQRKSV